jgi:hypothetical protein
LVSEVQASAFVGACVGNLVGGFVGRAVGEEGGRTEGTDDGDDEGDADSAGDVGATGAEETRICLGIGAIVHTLIIIGHRPFIIIVLLFMLLYLHFAPHPFLFRSLSIRRSRADTGRSERPGVETASSTAFPLDAAATMMVLEDRGE